jgi:hypothetical protein
MKLALKVDRPDKAVMYFTWGREKGAAPNVETLLELLAYIKPMKDWKLIVIKLEECIRPTYPEYWQEKHGKKKNKNNIISKEAVADALQDDPPQPQEESSLKDVSNVPVVGSPDPSGTVNWVKFALDPTGHPTESVQAFSANLSSQQKKELLKQESPRKIAGHAQGGRKLRKSIEAKSLTDSELQSIELSDSVVVGAVVQECLARNLPDLALGALGKAVLKAEFLLSPEAFLPMACYYRDQRNVEGVMQLLVMMMKGNIAPNIDFLNLLLELHVLVENWVQAVELWKQLPSFNVQANNNTINILLFMMVHAERARKNPTTTLFSILKFAQENDLVIDDVGLTHMMTYGIRVKNYNEVLALFKRLKNVNPEAYHMQLEALQFTNQFPKFLSAFHQIEKYNIPLSWELLRTCLKACYFAGKPEIFLMILKYAVNKSSFTPSLYHFRIFAMRAISYGYISHALEMDIFRQEMVPPIPITMGYIRSFTYDKFIKTLSPKFKPPKPLEKSTCKVVQPNQPNQPKPSPGRKGFPKLPSNTSAWETPEDEEPESSQEETRIILDDEFTQAWDATVRTWHSDRKQMSDVDKKAHGKSNKIRQKLVDHRQNKEKEHMDQTKERFTQRMKSKDQEDL